MEKNNIKIYLLGVVSAIILILAAIGVVSLVKIYKSEPLPVDTTIRNMYATVLKSENGSIEVDPIDEEIEGTYTVKVDYDFEVGDFVLVDGDKVTLIAKNDNFETTSKITDTTTSRTTMEDKKTTSSTISTTGKTTTKKTTTKKNTTTTTKKSTTKKTTTKKENVDNAVISYVENASLEVTNGNANDETFGQKAKRYFITVVDFIFYDGEIKGYTWDELSTSAKAKVVYYALKIDSKIDEKFPDYKQTISDKYNDIKAKLVAKYLDITNSICSNSEYDKKHCDIVKQDFELLKKSVGITWDIVVDAFKYAYDKTASYLKTWYETFSGK